MTSAAGAPRPEDVAEAIRNGQKPSELPGAELAEPRSRTGEGLTGGDGPGAALGLPGEAGYAEVAPMASAPPTVPAPPEAP